MTVIAFALIGGLVWIGLRGQADVATFSVGMALSALAAWATRLPWQGSMSPARLFKGSLLGGRILLRFASDLAAANARQLRLVLSPTLRVRSRWVRFTTRLEHPGTRIVLGVLISLTPGTVTEELRGREYVIHVLDAGPDEDPIGPIRERFETLLVDWEAL